MPSRDHAPLGTVWVKPWSSWPGHYIALPAPTGTEQARRASTAAPTPALSPPLHAYLAVIELDAGGASRLAARPLLVDPTMDWRGSLQPSGPEAADDPTSGDGAPAPSSYDRLDLAPYRIAPDAPAFGLRAS